MDAIVRHARIDDYEALCSVCAETDALHADALSHFFRPVEGPVRSREYVASLLDDENAAILVAELGGDIIGVLMVLIRKAPDYPMYVPRTWAAIDFVGVRSTHRRRGIGRALAEAAHDWARQRGITDVELSVWEFNEGARAFYEELGYQTISRHMYRTLT